jgi:ankyrin repeat protein
MLAERRFLKINQVGVNGNTALHFVAKTCDIELYDLLVNKGADENIKNNVLNYY